MLGKAEIAAIVPVSDVERAVEFYGGTLGLELQIRRDDLPENREAEFRAGDGVIGRLRERGRRPEPRYGGRIPRRGSRLGRRRPSRTRSRLRGVRPPRPEDGERDRHDRGPSRLLGARSRRQHHRFRAARLGVFEDRQVAVADVGRDEAVRTRDEGDVGRLVEGDAERVVDDRRELAVCLQSQDRVR